MKNNTIESYLQNYLDWIKNNSFEEKLDENVSRLSIPFLDMNMDYAEIYIKKISDGYYLTDNGETISNLWFSGVDLKRTRKDIFESTIKNYGISTNAQNELFVKAAADNLPQKKHLLLQCMLKISDMYILSKSNVKSLFIEDVKKYFDDNNVSYVLEPSFFGKSGLLAQYDFAIGKTQKRNAKLVKVSNRLDKSSAKSIIFDWSDTEPLRREKTDLIVVSNDEAYQIKDDAVTALLKYNIAYAPWSQRDESLLKSVV